MAETPEGVVQDMLVSNAASPDAAPNGRLDPPTTDADGDVNMETTHVNGHTDVKLDTLNDAFAYRSPNHIASPPQVDADADDDARPPPAKRARKLSDADQASIANVSQAPWPLIPTYSSCVVIPIHQDCISSSRHWFLHSDE